MKPLSEIPFSVLDLSPIRQGGTAAESFRNTLDLARHAERLGLPPVLGGRAPRHPRDRQRRDRRRHRPRRRRHARDPRRGRRHHAPQPRPAGDRRAVRHPGVAVPRPDRPGPGPGPGRRPRGPPGALRRHLGSGGDTFPQDLQELMGYFRAGRAGQRRPRGPGRGAGRARSGCSGRATSPPGWRPSWGCRSRSPPTSPRTTCTRPWPCTARTSSRRSALAEPHVMVGVNVFAADTDAEARRLFTSVQQQFLNLVRGHARGCCRRRSSRWTGCGPRTSGRTSSG